MGLSPTCSKMKPTGKIHGIKAAVCNVNPFQLSFTCVVFWMPKWSISILPLHSTQILSSSRAIKISSASQLSRMICFKNWFTALSSISQRQVGRLFAPWNWSNGILFKFAIFFQIVMYLTSSIRAWSLSEDSSSNKAPDVSL